MTVRDEVYEEFKLIGEFLEMRGLNSSHSGNLSVRRGNKMFIKRRGAMLGHLKPDDIVETMVDEPTSSIMISSTETGVHRAIYQHTSALAVVHCHPPYTVVLSMIEDEITAIDAEGAFVMKKIPVLDLEHPVGPADSAEHVPPVLKNYPLCVVRSHGVFCGAITLEEAYKYVTVAEQISMIRYLTMLTGKPLKRDVSEQFNNW